MIDPFYPLSLGLLAFVIGYGFGAWREARQWREKGDHNYMNRMSSGRYLYHVKRETSYGRTHK